MKNDVSINNEISIPDHELEIITSRSGGPGGQHVNTTNSRVTVRWNIKNTQSLNSEQKERVLERLQAQLTTDGDLIVHNSHSRSQLENKKQACLRLAELVRAALHVPKKRKAPRVPKVVKETRLRLKKQRSMLKKERAQKF